MNKSDFINKVLFGYIRKDLEVLKRDVTKRSGEAGNINFPIALCVLAYMEYLGSFFTPKSREYGKNNIKVYIEECFNDILPALTARGILSKRMTYQSSIHPCPERAGFS